MLFVLAGSISSGVVKPGMSVRVCRSATVNLKLKIDAIEFLRHAGGEEDVCLCIRCENEADLGLLEGLNIGDEAVPVE